VWDLKIWKICSKCMSGTIYTYVYIWWTRFEGRPLDEVCEPLWSTPGKCCTAILDISEFYAWRGSSYWQILGPWWSSRGIFCRRPPSNRWNDHRPPKITFKRSETSRALRTCLGTLHASSPFKPLSSDWSVKTDCDVPKSEKWWAKTIRWISAGGPCRMFRSRRCLTRGNGHCAQVPEPRCRTGQHWSKFFLLVARTVSLRGRNGHLAAKLRVISPRKPQFYPLKVLSNDQMVRLVGCLMLL